MPKIKLTGPLTHGGVQRDAGDVIEVSEDSANFILRNDLGIVVAESCSAEAPSDEPKDVDPPNDSQPDSVTAPQKTFGVKINRK